MNILKKKKKYFPFQSFIICSTSVTDQKITFQLTSLSRWTQQLLLRFAQVWQMKISCVRISQMKQTLHCHLEEYTGDTLYLDW